MVRINALTLAMAFATTVLASPAPQAKATLDTVNGRPNVGAANCLQFITGECTSNEDCTDGCCAGIMVADPTSAAGTQIRKGICSGIDVGDVAGKLGCNFPLNDGALSGICKDAGGQTASEKRPERGESIPISQAVGAGTQAGVQAPNQQQCTCPGATTNA